MVQYWFVRWHGVLHVAEVRQEVHGGPIDVLMAGCASSVAINDPKLQLVGLIDASAYQSSRPMIASVTTDADGVTQTRYGRSVDVSALREALAHALKTGEVAAPVWQV